MKINKILVVILALFIPFIILMGGVRLIMSPVFAELEYDRAGFPLDPYGMETPDRKQWAGYSIRYLTNNEPIDYLGNLQTFQGQKIFTESELSHMVDVKKVVQGSLIAWYILIGLSVAILGWFLIMGQWSSLRQSFQAGGWVTLGLIGALLIFLLVSFDTLFTRFHQLFFADGTWLFDESSTLIRLFPFVFWRDAFALVLVFTLVVGILLVLITHKRKAKVVA
jgi:integral membrane protein (TIGR01906 family)